MSTPVCISCHKSKPQLACGVCAEPTCKNCAQFVEEETFSFLPGNTAAATNPAYRAQPVGERQIIWPDTGKEVFLPGIPEKLFPAFLVHPQTCAYHFLLQMQGLPLFLLYKACPPHHHFLLPDALTARVGAIYNKLTINYNYMVNLFVIIGNPLIR